MIVKLEYLVAKGARGVEDRIAVNEASVANGELGFALGHVFAIQVD
jgi:hypothetical protein